MKKCLLLYVVFPILAFFLTVKGVHSVVDVYLAAKAERQQIQRLSSQN